MLLSCYSDIVALSALPTLTSVLGHLNSVASFRFALGGKWPWRAEVGRLQKLKNASWGKYIGQRNSSLAPIFHLSHRPPRPVPPVRPLPHSSLLDYFVVPSVCRQCLTLAPIFISVRQPRRAQCARSPPGQSSFAACSTAFNSTSAPRALMPSDARLLFPSRYNLSGAASSLSLGGSAADI